MGQGSLSGVRLNLQGKLDRLGPPALVARLTSQDQVADSVRSAISVLVDMLGLYRNILGPVIRASAVPFSRRCSLTS